MPPAEPGYATSEFWLSLLAALVGVLAAFNVAHISSQQVQALGALIVLVVPAAYAIGRSIRKRGTPGK